MIYIDNKYGLIKFTYFYIKLTIIFRTYPQNILHVCNQQHIELGSSAVNVADILHTLTRDAVSLFYKEFEINLTQKQKHVSPI